MFDFELLGIASVKSFCAYRQMYVWHRIPSFVPSLSLSLSIKERLNTEIEVWRPFADSVGGTSDAVDAFKLSAME
jgi:hypothetical protein